MGATKKLLNASVALGCLSLMACGGGGGGGGGTTTTTATTPVPVDGITAPASWNFDDDTMQGWVLAPGYEGLWHLSAVRSASAPNSLAYNDPATGTFDTGATTAGAVASPELTLGAAPALSLDYFLDTEYLDGTNGSWDQLRIGVSTDGGATFTELTQLVDSESGFTGTGSLDLAAYANQNVILGIEFDSVDNFDNAYEGAYVDNIVVTDGVVAHTIRTSTPSVATTEAGGTDTFDIVLNTAPAADVTVAISSDNTAEALVMGGDSAVYTDTITVTFTTANWNVPQTVSVQGHTDGVVDGDALYNVVIAPAVSLDNLYSGVDAADITAVNTDDAATLAQCDGVDLALSDDGSVAVPVGFNFNYQGVDYSSVWINANGSLSFTTGISDFTQSVTDFLAGAPRIAALWDDLYPPFGGTISCVNNAVGSVTVSFDQIADIMDSSITNTFDITLSSNGNIEIAYGTVMEADALVGVTDGLSLTTVDPGETDLSANPAQSATGTTYEIFGGGGTDDVDLSGTTLTFTPAPAP